MNINPRRGEISARIDGREWCLCLTLGALAELEHALSIDNLSTLCNRFANDSLSAKDIIAVIGSGLRGGGHQIENEEVAEMRIDGGVVGFATLAARLLNATFTQSSHEPDDNSGLTVDTGEMADSDPKR